MAQGGGPPRLVDRKRPGRGQPDGARMGILQGGQGRVPQVVHRRKGRRGQGSRTRLRRRSAQCRRFRERRGGGPRDALRLHGLPRSSRGQGPCGRERLARGGRQFRAAGFALVHGQRHFPQRPPRKALLPIRKTALDRHPHRARRRCEDNGRPRRGTGTRDAGRKIVQGGEPRPLDARDAQAL